MGNFLVIGCSLLAGYLLRRSESLPPDAHKGINAFLLYLALPAVSFKYLPHIRWTDQLLIPVLMPLLVWTGSFVYISFYARAAGLSKKSAGALQLTTGLGNTSFLGFTLVAAYLGEPALATAVICDQVTFMLLSTVGLMVAVRASRAEGLSFRFLFGRLIRFAPLIACLLALTVPRWVDLSALDGLWDRLAATIAPLALFSVGLQLNFRNGRQAARPVFASLLFKLVLGPAVLMGIFLLLGIRGEVAKVTLLECAMPSLVTSGVVAAEYHLNARLAGLVIGWGILVALLTTAAWYWVMQQWL